MAKKIADFNNLRESTQLITADGRRVSDVRCIPDAYIWRWEVTVEGVTYRVNSNGRRYANTPSDDDIYYDWPYDCMPEPIKAIEAVREGRFDAVRSANKECEVVHPKGDVSHYNMCTITSSTAK